VEVLDLPGHGPQRGDDARVGRPGQGPRTPSTRVRLRNLANNCSK
jgi:hypothetical protein